MEQQGLLELKEYSEEESIDQLSYSQRKHHPRNMERKLCIILIVSFILAFSIAATFGYIYQANKGFWKSPLINSNIETLSERVLKNFPSDVSSSNPCVTPGCVKAAATILSNIDESIDPCTDFYQFACGGWMKQHQIPESMGSVSFFASNQYELNLRLKDLLEKKVNVSEPPFVSMLKSMYETCMDLKSIERENTEPLRRVLKILGGWPVVEGNTWNETAFDWIETLKYFRDLGYSHRVLLDLSVGIDHKNISTHIIKLDQAILGMPDRTYLLHGLNDSSAVAYFNLMLNVAKRLGANQTTVENELMDSLNFEIALAQISLPREAFRNSSATYNKYTVQKLQELIPQVPWLKYLNSLLSEDISEDEPLVVLDLNFIAKFGELISITDKRVIANYMMWRAVFESLESLSVEWRNLLHQYRTAISGINQQSPRWGTCLSYLTDELSMALSSYYVRNYFDEERKETSMQLYRYIHEEFLENLEDIDWMEKETKQKAKEKVEAIKAYSGYPNELLDDALVQEYYMNLTIANNSFFDNILKIRKWMTDSEFSLLRKPYIKRQWTKHTKAIVVNSFYKTFENSIEFLAGILQEGFFDKNRPHYMNFGAIGFVLAHELTHSLDDVGSQFDKDGNNEKWWDKTTEKNFRKKSQCIVDQFSNITAENGMKLNGLNTEGENIADNGGFKLAYKAYQSWIRDYGPEQMLPGLKYTPSQLFWISTANIWCVKFRPEALKLRILTGTHIPDNFRITGGLSNLKEFSQEFHCSSNTQMNSQNKCIIW